MGGWVRDQLVGIRTKDLDLEVYGLPLDNLFGVFGRAAGSAPGFEFSDAMMSAAVVWDAATRRPYRELSGHENTAIRLRFAPDSRHLVTVNTNGTVFVLRLRGPVGPEPE